jgi:hypothetical protein
MESATIILRGALSHSVRLPGAKNELVLKQDKAHTTTDEQLIKYCESRSQLFSVKRAKAPVAQAQSAPVVASDETLPKKPGRKKKSALKTKVPVTVKVEE